MSASPCFDIDCVRCPRLARHLQAVRRDYPAYHGRPVAPFGARKPALLIVGLAPGLHGANATGRPFTGDYAGILLYKTLYRYGFSNLDKVLDAGDGLKLRNCRITNAVKCLPPENKPNGAEIRNCNAYLQQEISRLGRQAVILALGGIAHRAVLKALGMPQTGYKFAHGALHQIEGHKCLLDSYHCSRYNTQTRRLTESMFFEIFDKIHEIIDITN